MANKRISDFPTLHDANDDDLLLVSSKNDTYNVAVGVLKEAAKKVANDAVEKAEAALDNTEAQGKKLTSMSLELDTKVDGAYVENGYLYLTSNGEVVAGPLGPFSGGGGGGGGTGGYIITLTNLMDSRVLTVSGGTPVYLSFSYSSADANGDDGPGVGTLTVNNVKAANFAIPQGANMIEISPYLVSGENSVKLKVENAEASSRTLSYTITVVSLGMTTPFDALGTYTGSVVFNYTVTGSGTKTVHFLMDGTEIGSEEVSSSGRSRSYTIPQQSAGAHVLTAYAELTVAGANVKSNVLTIGMMWISASISTPSVLSTFTQDNAVQGYILDIPYMVYDPLNEEATITLSVISPGGAVYSSQNLTVDRTAQSWKVQNYPIGAVTFRIACGTARLEHTVNVAESGIIIEPVTDALALYFDPTGRSNNEDGPESWAGNGVTASFSGVSFSTADGWLTDADGASILRLLPGGSMNIPFKLFENDARDSGATVEVEMATHNVRDYDTVVMSCLSGGRGFKIASQYAQFNSEQSEVSMQFKEDEKVRVSFVIEPRNLHRLIYVFVDGVMCGVIQYPAADNFQQSPAAGITIGAETSGIDVYRIRLYTKGLTRHEVLDNYVADRSLLSERIDAAKRNDIFDLSENIVISKLPMTLPYMIIKCAELPQYKGDKKTCSVEYVNPADPSRSFTAEGVEIDVQGTSSAGYKKKNFKEKFKKGLTYTATGEQSGTYQLRESSVPAAAFCMKADVASSEGANNVELVRLYNDTVPYKTPPQQQDSRVRVGIDGLPCVIFWQNTTGETAFWGKYNFNDEKSSEQVYGLTDGCESWEVLNNTSSRVLFKSADFSGTGWQDDFEARYPDGNTNSSKLAAMVAWVASTDRNAVSSESDKAARLTKFKNEFEDHFVKAPMLFYYLFTEVFLMVDSRAKNFFPTTFDGVHWQPLPYDMDTAIGINNEGQLVFDYDLEDTDTVGGSPVFNGQDSALWCNIRDAFADDLKAMYNELRSGTLFNYPEIVRRFAAHQATWPEAVWNEDAWEKYLEPLENDNDGSYLTMLQGNKGSQREWWLYNGLRYRDSKYQCGDAQNTFITLRCYQVGDITVTPYSHIWPRIKYGSYTVTQRGKRNVPVTLHCPLDNMSDTEVYIYSADRLAAIGDLSGLQVGYANFSMAVKLQSLKLGDGSTGYQNTRLNELYVGNNELLVSLDVQNCVNLTQSVDLSGCVGIEEVKAKGSAVTGFTLPVGGKLKTLELPGTVTNLTLREQGQLQTLAMEGYSSLTTLRVEYTPNVPLEEILNGADNLDRVRLLGVEWTAANEAALAATITKLGSCIGMDASGGNIDKAVVTGRVYVPSISADLLAEINNNFPQLVVVADGVAQYIVRYLDWDNSLLYRAVVAEGASAVNPVTEGYINAPIREGTEDTGYTFRDFGELPTDIHSNVSLLAQYDITYRVLFMNDDTVYNTQWVTSGENAASPSGTPIRASTAQYSYSFVGWNRNQNSTTADSTALQDITAPRTLYATYGRTVRTYTVKFYNGSTLLQTVNNVAYGSSAKYTGNTPVSSEGSAEDYPFEGWNPPPTNIQGNTNCRAQFGSPLEIAEITDSWDQILAACSDGSAATKYKIGNYKPLDLGADGIIDMQITGINVDKLADGSGMAPLSWLGIQLLNVARGMGPERKANYDYTDRPSWAVGTGSNNNLWTTETMYCSGSVAKATWKVTAETDGTLTISYSTSNASANNKLTVKVNSVAIVEDYHATAYIDHTVECKAGDEVTVYAEYTLSSADYYTGKVRLTSTGTISIDATIEDAPKRVVRDYVEGTGAIGGWEKCRLRTELKALLPLIPENVSNGIKPVLKSQESYENDGSGGEVKVTQTTEDDVWIPSYNEMFGYSSIENQPRYKVLFPNSASRIKKTKTSSSASTWWLRSASTSGMYFIVYPSGNYQTDMPNTAYRTVLGFCT